MNWDVSAGHNGLSSGVVPDSRVSTVHLVTGKGGVGKTSIAAATAAHSASQNVPTLIVSTDAAHSLADVFEAWIGPTPTEVAPSLYAQQLDTRHQIEESWTEIQNYLGQLIDWAGDGGLSCDELLIVPGMQEVFALENLLAHVEQGRFDRIIVDCAPTAETLRLLELPEAVDWYFRQVFPTHRRLVRATRPIFRRTTSMPLLDTNVLDALVAFVERVRAVRDLLVDPNRCAVRLVTTAERMVVDETRRLFAYLRMFGYRVDALMINRLLPAGECGSPMLDRWRASEIEQLQKIDESFPDLPTRRLTHRGSGPLGLTELTSLGRELYGTADSFDPRVTPSGLDFEGNGHEATMRLSMPGFDHTSVAVGRSGSDVIITAGSERRAVALPDSLAARPTRGWKYDGDELRVLFAEEEWS